MAAPSTEYIPGEEAVSKNMAMQHPKCHGGHPQGLKERGKWLQEAEKVGKMQAAMTKLLLDKPHALQLLNQGQVMFLGPHTQMLWEFLAEDMGMMKAHHLSAPISVENKDLPLDAWVEDNNDVGPIPPAIAALNEEDTKDGGVLPGDSQETDQLASNLQKQVVLVAKPLISGMLPWGSILAAVLAPTGIEQPHLQWALQTLMMQDNAPQQQVLTPPDIQHGNYYDFPGNGTPQIFGMMTVGFPHNGIDPHGYLACQCLPRRGIQRLD
ncbi:hypothetical protein DACRYDRAFT_109658 [Dacryopinax primogenitus]|uniref:Uncharacterized protein n=1 Tax=Dacryopinax primogenitus (strain DJM 731) TaxID=1858805 RepID=M5G161_DACPD|nr:uncharacterized protein DACRYDRAFT_109658 [Dacryopinax primogenitus]EJT99561.1 hypothetical protein DACRYDRAFT_109658 [Dacryopinax primogenitus]